jgi:menaquinone-specific isochorismate synthase
MLEKINSSPVSLAGVKKILLYHLNQRLTRKENYPPVLRFAIPLKSVDLLAWLQRQSTGPKLYWFDKKDDLEVAAVGAADIVSGHELSDYTQIIQRILKHSSDSCTKCRYYGGFSFYKNTAIKGEWEAFGAYQFVLPRFEIVKKDGNDFFVCTIVHPEDEEIIQLVRELDKLNFSDSLLSEASHLVDKVYNLPDNDQWQKLINTALKRIRNDEFDKIVLARRVELEMLSYTDPFSIISELRKTNHHTVSFCFQPREDMTFIGVTPEILYRRKNREILSEAVAGTRLRGRNNTENESLAKELLTNEKELREHGFVTKSLKRNLSRLCTDLTSSDKVTVLKLSQLQHLFVPFKGTLEKEVTDGEILEALHPTPAVGGFPEKSILPILRQSEPFNRGWYAAPVGWTGADSATFAVAIRSALILKNKIYLYSGAGIVDGSSPEKEWEELDNKIAHYKKLLGVDGKQTKKHQQLLGLSAG